MSLWRRLAIQQWHPTEVEACSSWSVTTEGLTSFVDDPHAAIDGTGQGEIINLADRRAGKSRTAQLDLLSSLGPDKITAEFAKIARPQVQPTQFLLPHLLMPSHHDIRPSDVVTRRLHGNLAAAADRGPADFPELLLTPGVGARTVQASAMVAGLCTEHRIALRIPPGFRLRMAARIGIHSPCHSKSTTKRSAC